jgi:hypothetical protein
MPAKRALGITTAPDATADLLFPPACRTLARCAPLRTSEARDTGLRGLVHEIDDIPATFPLGHALVVMASGVLMADAVGITDEEGSRPLLLAERNHLVRAFVAQVLDLAARAPAHLPPGGLQPAAIPGIGRPAFDLYGWDGGCVAQIAPNEPQGESQRDETCWQPACTLTENGPGSPLPLGG